MKTMTYIGNLQRCSTIFAVLLVLLSARWAFARLVPPRDAKEGVLDATLVVIVSKEGKDVFRTEEVLLGQRKPGDSIRLPGFRLYTIQMYGPEKVELITERTRILLFLKPKEKNPDAFEVTSHGYCFFWVHEPEKITDLRRVGNKALELRNSWEKARDIQDERKRVEALWAYLWNHGVSFFRHTQRELQETGTAAGDYIAERLPDMSHGHRMSLLPELGAYGSKQLHTFLIGHLKQQRQIYETFLRKHGFDSKGLIEDWNKVPSEIKNVYGELYYGLAGLASFRDRKDLEFIRELALWAADHRFKQTCDAALGAFRNMPDKANLPVIDSIWKEFSTKPYKGNALSPFDVTRALRSHKFPDTVPVLAQLLGNDKAGNEARAFLTEIVGEDFGSDMNAWMKWYEANKESSRWTEKKLGPRCKEEKAG